MINKLYKSTIIIDLFLGEIPLNYDAIMLNRNDVVYLLEVIKKPNSFWFKLLWKNKIYYTNWNSNSNQDNFEKIWFSYLGLVDIK